MSRIPPSGRNGTTSAPRYQIGDSYPDPLTTHERPIPGAVGNYQSYQRSQRLQTPLEGPRGTAPEGSGVSGSSGVSGNSGNSGVSGSHEAALILQRDRAVFRLVRRLKRDHRDMPSDAELRRYWESDRRLRAIPWDDFRLRVLEGWTRVKHQSGTGPLSQALATADQRPVQCVQRYENPQLRRLVSLCAVLQERAKEKAFPLASEAVAEEFKVPQPTVSRWLRLLVQDGVLGLTFKGHTGKASEYRFLGGQG
jgi:hypothetical protein